MMHLVFLLGCGSTPRVTLPDMTNVREGDWILTYGGTLNSCFLTAMCKRPDQTVPPRYSHAEMLIKDEQRQWLLTGVADDHVSIRPLDQAVSRFARYVIVRPAYSASEQQCVTNQAKQWGKDPQILQAKFDYSFEDVPGKTDSFYCAGYLNELYRQCDLPQPLVPFIPNNPLWTHLNRLGNLSENRPVSAGFTLLDRPGSQIIMRWENPSWDKQRLALYQAMMDLISQWYNQGWQFIPSNQSDLLLKLSPFPERLHDVARVRISLTSFEKDVVAMWNRLKRRGLLEHDIPNANQPQVQAICLKYRDRYFQRADSDSNDTALRMSNDTDDKQ